MSYGPAEGGGPDPQRLPAQPGSSRRLPEQLHLPRADDGGPDPQPFQAHPASNGRPHPGGFIIQSGRRETRSPLPHGSQPTSNRCQRPDWFTVHVRRAENSNPMRCRTIRLATGPGAPVRFALHWLTRLRVPGRSRLLHGRTKRVSVRREGVEPSRPLGHGFLRPGRLPGFATSAWSGRRGSNPRPSTWQADALTI
jgi:hypothetical protein